jgi:serine/threonine protein phosphatase 1
MPDWFKHLATLSPPVRSVGAGQRVYAIGDVHGCLSQLLDLKRQIEADNTRRAAAHVTLVYVGDYIDRGPQSAGVLDEVVRPLPGINQTIHLKGNHEAMLLQFIADPVRARDWLRNGGVETLESFGVDSAMAERGHDLEATRDALVAAMSSAHREFLDALPLTVRIGDYFFCHAGVRPGVALDQQREPDLVWIREPFLNSWRDFGARIVHGHTPVASPEVKRNRINVDTGCFATGRLTAAILDGDTAVTFLRTEARSTRTNHGL